MIVSINGGPLSIKGLIVVPYIDLKDYNIVLLTYRDLYSTKIKINILSANLVIYRIIQGEKATKVNGRYLIIEAIILTTTVVDYLRKQGLFK